MFMELKGQCDKTLARFLLFSFKVQLLFMWSETFAHDCNIVTDCDEPAVNSVANRTLSVREVWGSIPGPVKSAQCCQRLATAATFLRSCAVQALSCGDRPRYLLHASA